MISDASVDIDDEHIIRQSSWLRCINISNILKRGSAGTSLLLRNRRDWRADSWLSLWRLEYSDILPDPMFGVGCRPRIHRSYNSAERYIVHRNLSPMEISSVYDNANCMYICLHFGGLLSMYAAYLHMKLRNDYLNAGKYNAEILKNFL